MPPGKPIRELHFSSKNASFTLINYSSQATFFNSVLTKKRKMWPLLMLLISVSLKESILMSLPCYSLWEMSLLDSENYPTASVIWVAGRDIPSGLSSEICHKRKMDFPLLQILSIIKRIPIGWTNLLWWCCNAEKLVVFLLLPADLKSRSLGPFWRSLNRERKDY